MEKDSVSAPHRGRDIQRRNLTLLHVHTHIIYYRYARAIERAHTRTFTHAMKHLFTGILLACILLLDSSAVSAQTSTLASRMNRLVDKLLPPGSEVGISVYDLTANKQLYAYRDDKLSRPASTMKLVTLITALACEGGNEPFATRLYYKGAVQQDTLRGDLYVIGGFDPEFGDAEMDSLVSAVAALPFTAITGKVYGDVSMKDSLYWGSGWLWDDTPAAFQPYLSPLMFHKGVASVTARPATLKGEEAMLVCQPASSFYTLTNHTQSRAAEAGKFTVSRNWLNHGNNILVSGNVEGRLTGEVNLYPSQDFFMHTFVERLRSRGIAADSLYAYAEFIDDSTAVHIARVESPFQPIINRLMKKSDNLNAEALLCRLGALHTGGKRVSAAHGLEAVNNLITQLGADPKAYKIADGSGLSNYNYLSPALLTRFLRFAYADTQIFRQLYKSLPIAGVDGTLQYRMGRKSKAHRKVHAKTGSFTGISTLAGYAKAANGHDIAFAIMNQNVMRQADARRLQDAICELLCE